LRELRVPPDRHPQFVLWRGGPASPPEQARPARLVYQTFSFPTPLTNPCRGRGCASPAAGCARLPPVVAWQKYRRCPAKRG